MTDHFLEIERPYQQSDPLDMDDARRASREVARLRRRTEADYRKAIDDRANKEATYRQKLSEAIVRLKTENASTTAAELARGDSTVKQALVEYRVAEGMVKAYELRLTGIEGERSMLKSLIDYSARVNAALRGGDEQRQGEQPIGMRRAA